MSLDPKAQTILALHRFGFGPRFGANVDSTSDPRGLILSDIERKNAGLVSGPGLIPSDEALRADHNERERLREERKRRGRRQTPIAVKSDSPEPMAKAVPGATSAGQENNQPLRNGREARRDILHAEIDAHIDAALGADIGFAERLVWFWSNHFCVSIKSGVLKSVVGSFEREAIRPHILGKFTDMLLAAESHPAMLMYLDNVRSFGPNSRFGSAHDRGLNENLARECLELHTLGVRTVYTQADVTNFAKVLTGWTLVPPRVSDTHGGQFEFSEDRHEPGPQTVVGKVYPDTGVEQGRAVLRDIARHPETAHHIATKLAIHFVADTPPPSLVDRLTKRFLESEGDLKEVTKTLVQSDETWAAPRTKLKPPSEWSVGALRAVGVSSEHISMVTKAQNMLSEPLWHAPSPKGYSDQSSEWTDGIAERLDIATFFSRRLDAPAHPNDLLDRALGPLASAETRSEVSRAADSVQGLTLVFMAPEFQMR